jgi:hypothetical protein
MGLEAEEGAGQGLVVGAGAMVTHGRRCEARRFNRVMGGTMRSYILPAIVVLIGVLFLLVNMGFLPSLGIRELLGDARESVGGRWWPIILIALGAWLFVRRSRT